MLCCRKISHFSSVRCLSVYQSVLSLQLYFFLFRGYIKSLSLKLIISLSGLSMMMLFRILHILMINIIMIDMCVHHHTNTNMIYISFLLQAWIRVSLTYHILQFSQSQHQHCGGSGHTSLGCQCIPRPLKENLLTFLWTCCSGPMVVVSP